MKNYSFSQALRPFSFSVAIVACALGAALAAKLGSVLWWQVGLIIAAGVMVQASVNLLNDYADISQLKIDRSLDTRYVERSIATIRSNLRVAKLLFIVSLGIALYFVWETDLGLLVFCLLGILGGYYYTQEPINYKARGLGVVGVFCFTGVLMVSGSYYALSGQIDWVVLGASVPAGLFSSLLLLANELRDEQDDRSKSIATLTVRIGKSKAIQAFALLGLLCVIWGIYPLVLVGAFSDDSAGLWAYAWLLAYLPALLASKSIYICLKHEQSLEQLPPLTGRVFVLYGAAYITLLLA